LTLDLSVYVALKIIIIHRATLVDLFPLTLIEILQISRCGFVTQVTMHGASAVTLVLLYVLHARPILHAHLVRALLLILYQEAYVHAKLLIDSIARQELVSNVHQTHLSGQAHPAGANVTQALR
jgi:hypothetical protein